MADDRTLYLDLESAPALCAVFPPLHDTSAVWVERATHLLCAAWAWGDSGKVHVRTLADYKLFKQNPHDDRALLKELYEVVSAADAVVAHGANRFDLPLLRARLLACGFPPLRPLRQIDTLRLARATFKFDSAKLDNIARQLNLGTKLPTGMALWRECYGGHVRAFKKLGKYCAGDVALLQRIHSVLKPWVPNPPLPGRRGCPACGSDRGQTQHGERIIRSRRVPQTRCGGCGHYYVAKTP